MPKLFAAVLIGLVAFAVLLAGLTALGSLASDPGGPARKPPGSGQKPGATSGAPGTPTTTAPATGTSTRPPASGVAVEVESVEAAWAHDADGAPLLALRVTLRNSGDGDATATGATWSLQLQGRRATQGQADLDVAVPPGTATVEVDVPFDGETAADWFTAYARDGEAGRVAVTGTVAVRPDRAGATAKSLPFSWDAAWDGTLADAVGLAADCATSTADVCLQATEAKWSRGGIELRLTFANRGPSAVRLRGDATLAFDGTAVATGELDRTYVLSGDTGTADARLLLSTDALASWWDGHVARCESTPAQLVLDLAADDGVPADWALPLAPFGSSIACGGDA